MKASLIVRSPKTESIGTDKKKYLEIFYLSRMLYYTVCYIILFSTGSRNFSFKAGLVAAGIRQALLLQQ